MDGTRVGKARKRNSEKEKVREKGDKRTNGLLTLIDERVVLCFLVYPSFLLKNIARSTYRVPPRNYFNNTRCLFILI